MTKAGTNVAHNTQGLGWAFGTVASACDLREVRRRTTVRHARMDGRELQMNQPTIGSATGDMPRRFLFTRVQNFSHNPARPSLVKISRHHMNPKKLVDFGCIGHVKSWTMQAAHRVRTQVPITCAKPSHACPCFGRTTPSLFTIWQSVPIAFQSLVTRRLSVYPHPDRRNLLRLLAVGPQQGTRKPLPGYATRLCLVPSSAREAGVHHKRDIFSKRVLSCVFGHPAVLP